MSLHSTSLRIKIVVEVNIRSNVVLFSISIIEWHEGRILLLK